MSGKPTYEELESRIKALEQERNQVEMKLKETGERFQVFSEASSEAIFLTEDGICIDQNPAAAKLFGYDRSDTIGKSATSGIVDAHRNLVEKHLQAGDEVTLDVDMLDKDGSPFPAELQMKQIRFQGNNIQVIACRDITKHKEIENDLKKREELYRQLFQNASEAILVAQDGKLVFINPVTETISGYSSSELLEKQFIEFVYPEDQEQLIDRYLRRIGGEVFSDSHAFRFVRQDNSIRWVELNSVLIEWKDKPATLNFLNDITARRQAEDELKRSEERYRKLFERSNDAIFIVNGQTGEYLNANRAAEKMVELPLSDMLRKTAKREKSNEISRVCDSDKIGKFGTVNIVKHEDAVQDVLSEVRSRVSRHSDQEEVEQSKNSPDFETNKPEEIKFKSMDGSIQDAILTVIPIDNEQVIALVRDISKTKKAEERVRIASIENEKQKLLLDYQNRQLVEAAKLREDVDQLVRHDLKTPLNSMIGYPQLLLLSENITEAEKTYINMISESAYRMLDMINLSLDLFKMERGVYQLSPAPVDILRILKSILAEVESLRKTKNIVIRIEQPEKRLDGASEARVLGEELLCYSMFANLIKNAIEASPIEGLILIKIDYKKAAVISIHNKGVVPEEIRETFFNKFVTAGKRMGTGLGTYSAKLIAEIQQGNIEMATSETEGTTITVQLPLISGGISTEVNKRDKSNFQLKSENT